MFYLLMGNVLAPARIVTLPVHLPQPFNSLPLRDKYCGYPPETKNKSYTKYIKHAIKKDNLTEYGEANSRGSAVGIVTGYGLKDYSESR
jgi:hypothetical protein